MGAGVLSAALVGGYGAVVVGGGGGGGPYTFALASGMNSGGSLANPSNASVTAAAAGNRLFAILSDRSGVEHTSHSVTGGGTWSKIAFLENERLTADSRITTTLWTRDSVSGDTSGITVAGSVGGSNCLVSVIEVSVDDTFGWVLDDSAIAGSGTSPIPAPGQSSGNATASVNDVFVLHLGSARTSASAFSGQAFDPTTDVTQTVKIGENSLAHALGFDTDSKASGTYSSLYDLNEGTPDSKGISGVLIFKAS